uniref:hypothetical protein n=1 Tax=Aerococcus urinaeequi TaxID=51665 RepID=UPI00352AA120
MLKHHIKKEQLLSDLENEIEIYEDELSEGGNIEIQHFTGYHSKKGFDYDVRVILNDEDGDELQTFDYFSFTTDNSELAEKRIQEVKDLVEKKGYKTEITFN